MKLTIRNDGVGGTDAITIFVRHADGTTENYADIEGGFEMEINWNPEQGDRYEVVPWKRQ
jgi:hypothetical protein